MKGGSVKKEKRGLLIILLVTKILHGRAQNKFASHEDFKWVDCKTEDQNGNFIKVC